MRARKSILVGIAGGSGSGKTTYANAIRDKLNQQNPESCVIVSCDNFYKDRSKEIPNIKDRAKLDFDHPDSIDFALFAEIMKKLSNDEAVEIPLYDFKTHARKQETLIIKPTDTIIFEGILLFAQEDIKRLFDLKLSILAEEDTRVDRRKKRDIKERGRSPEQAEEQIKKTVLPNHDKFVEPSLKHVDFKINNDAERNIIHDPLNVDLFVHAISKRHIQTSPIPINKDPATFFSLPPTPFPSPEKKSYISRGPSPSYHE